VFQGISRNVLFFDFLFGGVLAFDDGGRDSNKGDGKSDS
jgi:hypothetical protein